MSSTDTSGGVEIKQGFGNRTVVTRDYIEITRWGNTQRIQRMAKIYLRCSRGRLGGRPETGQASRYLLSGLVRCEECGAAMIVSSGSIGSGGLQGMALIRSGRSQTVAHACQLGGKAGDLLPLCCDLRCHAPDRAFANGKLFIARSDFSLKCTAT